MSGLFEIGKPKRSKKVYEGPLFKKGKIHTVWRHRWFVLYNTRMLAYYENQKESMGGAFKPLGEIDLSLCIKLSDINDRSKDNNGKYIFEITSKSRTYVLSCIDLESLHIWNKYLSKYIFGDCIHHGWLIKKGEHLHSWRKRWFVLSDIKELRYYEDETLNKFKGIIKLDDVNLIRHGDKETYGYEYTIEIVTNDRTWVLVTTHHAFREIWMEKIGIAMEHPIHMNVLYEGYMFKFEEKCGSDLSVYDWHKSYFAIDPQSYELHTVLTHKKFKQFSHTIFFNMDYYQKLLFDTFKGSIAIKNVIAEEYGNNDKRFQNTSQKKNPFIFRIKNVCGEYYFACNSELEMKEWLHHILLVQPNQQKKQIKKKVMVEMPVKPKLKQDRRTFDIALQLAKSHSKRNLGSVKSEQKSNIVHNNIGFAQKKQYFNNLQKKNVNQYQTLQNPPQFQPQVYQQQVQQNVQRPMYNHPLMFNQMMSNMPNMPNMNMNMTPMQKQMMAIHVNATHAAMGAVMQMQTDHQQLPPPPPPPMMNTSVIDGGRFQQRSQTILQQHKEVQPILSKSVSAEVVESSAVEQKKSKIVVHRGMIVNSDPKKLNPAAQLLQSKYG